MEEDYEKEDSVPKYRSSDFVKKEINFPHFHSSDSPNQKGFKSASSNFKNSWSSAYINNFCFSKFFL